jgi:hypothetical protein
MEADGSNKAGRRARERCGHGGVDELFVVFGTFDFGF